MMMGILMMMVGMMRNLVMIGVLIMMVVMLTIIIVVVEILLQFNFVRISTIFNAI